MGRTKEAGSIGVSVSDRKNIAVKVLIKPTDSERGSGLTCCRSWESLRLAIESDIGLKPYERIVQIEVDESGITIRLEMKP